VAAALAADGRAETPAYVRETALARVARVRAAAGDRELVAAVLAKNATGESMEGVRRKDKEWMENPKYALRRELSSNACARRLRELTQDDAFIVEAIVMDAQGANVCVSRETSDYWQGDEAKFQKTFGADREIFVDEPALDASTLTYAIQLSAVVHEGKAKIGVVTLTLKVGRPDGPAETK
jgi:hypothetical protein